VRSVNPQTYTLNCTYSEEEVNNYIHHNYLDRYINHIKACRNSNCSYYQRLIECTGRIDGEARVAMGLSAMFAAMWITADVIAPFTGGLSILVAGALSAGGIIGADLVTENNIEKAVKEIENELKEK